MSYSDEVREALRLSKLRQCQQDPRGTAAVQLTLNGAAAVTVYAVVRVLEVEQLRALGLAVAPHGVLVEVPRQTATDSPTGDSFQGGVAPGDALTHAGATYRIRRVSRDDSDTVFLLLATRDLAIQRL